MAPLFIKGTLSLPAEDLSFRAVRASGPGGQNVNKVSSKVELTFELGATLALSEAVKERLRVIAGSHLNSDDRLLIRSQVTRDQRRNLEDARERLRALVLRALVAPTRRVATRKPARVNRARLADKRHAAARRSQRSISD